MSKENGWICLHRKMLKTSWYKHHPNAALLAVHLLLSATHKDYDTKFGTRKGTLLRGQYISGRYALSEEIGLSPWQVRNGLEVLKNAGFLTIQSTNRYSIITICNYNSYQTSDPDISQQFSQQGVVPPPPDALPPPSVPPETATKQQLTINNKQYIVGQFECLWSDYPRKDGKKEAFRHFNAHMNRTKQEDWEKTVLQYKQALMNYNNSEPVRRGESRYIKNGATWFNNWEDWITDPTSTPTMAKIDEIGAKYGLKRNTSKK